MPGEVECIVKYVSVKCPICLPPKGGLKFIAVPVMHGIEQKAMCSHGCGTVVRAGYDEKGVLYALAEKRS